MRRTIKEKRFKQSLSCKHRDYGKESLYCLVAHGGGLTPYTLSLDPPQRELLQIRKDPHSSVQTELLVSLVSQ